VPPGSVSTASWAAIPALVQMAISRAPAGYVEPLYLAAAIFASSDTVGVDGDRDQYAAQIADLRQVAERSLGYAEHDIAFLYAVQALIGLDGPSSTGRALQGVANGEIEIACPACGAYLYVVLEEDAFIATPNPDTTRTPSATLVPASPTELSGPDQQVYELACTYGHQATARALLHIMGTATCPICSHPFPMLQAIRADR
jgi:hypothetical protein